MQTVQQIINSKGHEVWSIHPNDTVFDAIQEMAEKNVGALVVVENDKLAGIISERDYARKVILEGKASKKTAVREIMVTHVICIRLDQRVDECMAIMTEKRIRHLPVMHEEQLAGMITLGDVVKSILEDQKYEIDQLHHYIHSV